jgi:hypothetical protein
MEKREIVNFLIEKPGYLKKSPRIVADIFDIDFDEEFLRSCYREARLIVNNPKQVEKVQSSEVDNTGLVLSKRWQTTNGEWRESYINPNEEIVDTEYLDTILEDTKKFLSTRELVKSKKIKTTENNIGVAIIADLHIGALVKNLLRTPDYDLETVISKLDKAAKMINKENYSSVHLAILGDIIESFTGLNHINSWKHLVPGMYGANVLLTAYEILVDFLSKINNLNYVYIISGNHDRVTSSNKEDTDGDVAKIVAYMLNINSEYHVNFDPVCISKNIDGIQYIFAHGHHGFSEKNITDVFFTYGNNKVFNLLLTGHLHTRKKIELVTHHDKTGVLADHSNYRAYKIPSIFTGNDYSEKEGYSSSSGFFIIESLDNKPFVKDIPL